MRLRRTSSLQAAGAPSRAADGRGRAIVVFGSGLDRRGRPSPSLRARLEKALELARSQPRALLVLTGGPVTHPVPEAEAMAAWLKARGVGAHRLVLEREARFTLDNAERVAPLLAAHRVRGIDLVTERFHLPRAEALMRGALAGRGQDVAVRPHPARNARFDPDRDRREARKLSRDVRNQAHLHGWESRIPFGGRPAVPEWWA